MSSWPADWPEPVRGFYAALADRFGWREATVEGVIANVEYLRALAESDRPRTYFEADIDKGRWLFEVVEDGGELIAIRQVVVYADGGVHRYSWRQREDDAGFLTDQAIDPSEGVQPSNAAAFGAAWGDGARPKD
jgi:hypothetical protein